MEAYFNRFTIEMTEDQARIGYHQGQCDEDVAELVKVPEIRQQLDKISDTDLSAELKEYGAWSEKELSDRTMNEHRIIWLAAGNIIEEMNGAN